MRQLIQRRSYAKITVRPKNMFLPISYTHTYAACAAAIYKTLSQYAKYFTLFRFYNTRFSHVFLNRVRHKLLLPTLYAEAAACVAASSVTLSFAPPPRVVTACFPHFLPNCCGQLAKGNDFSFVAV